MTQSPYMTVNEAADYLRVCRRTIERRLGLTLRYLKDGSRILVIREDVERAPKAPKQGKRSLYARAI